jgi:hypothetical protein
MEGSGQSNSEDEDQFTSNLLPLAKRPSDASQSGDDSMGVPTMNIASPKGFVTHEISASLYNEKEARAQNSIKEQIAKPHSVSSTEHDISNLEPTLFKTNVVPQQPPQVQNAYDNGIITEMASSQAAQRQNSLHNSSPYQQQQAGYSTASQPFYPQAQLSQQPTSQVQDNRPVQSQFSSVVQQPSQVPTDVIASTASPAINPTIQQQVRPLVGNTTAGNVFPASEYERNMLNFMNHPQAILMQQHLGMYTARTMAPNVSTPWSTFMPQQAATTQLQIPTTLVNHNSAVDLQRQQQLQAQQAAAAKNLTTPVNVQPTAQMFQQQALQPIQINQQPTLMNQQPQQMLQNAPRATQPSPQRESLTPHIFSSQQAVPRVNSPMVTRSPQPNMMAGQHSYQQGVVPMQQPVPVVQSPHMQYARTTEMVNASPMGYNHSPQPPAPHVKYPVLWEGQLVMKNTDTLVQMHKVFGDVKWMEKCNQEMVLRHNGIAAIRITQRMRLEPTQLEGVLRKMECPDDFIAFVCLPCGRSMEDIKRNMKTLNEAFIEYFTSKQAAGIANTGTVPNPSCVVHVFPPGDFTTNHLRRYAPDLLETVEQRKAGYLFVVITANTLNL